MPRKPRIEFEGAIYHVMSRGNRGDSVFLDDKDREIFLDTLDEACGRCGWRIHAFVLMGNHYHLLLETPEANLVAGMKWLQGTYTQRFNSRHKQWGHLFQGRYKALLVDGSSGEYFQTLGSYIHLNPARAKLFDLTNGKLTDYSWSSYPLYFRRTQRPSWLCVDRLLGTMGAADDRTGHAAFRSMMQKRVFEIAHADNPMEADSAWRRIRRGWYFGSDTFRDELLEKLDAVIGVKGKRASFDGSASRQHDELAAGRLLKAGLEAIEVNRESLPAMRKSCPEKCVLAWLLRKNTCVTNEWIRKQLHMGKATNFSALIKRVDGGDGEVAVLKMKLKNIEISD
ncbi:transposase [Verrucomicrobia bacterium S94]|nr:transposase [Verrucomicrobia bacterium S94]